MGIKEWPTTERPRERLLERGAQHLSDAELLAILLRTGIAGKSAVALARMLLSEFGGLRALLGADRDRFCAVPGLGEAKYAQIQAVVELARRFQAETLQRDGPLLNPAQSAEFLQCRLRDYPYEVFAVLFLDNRHQVLAFEELFRGTIDGASVHPREVVRRALHHNAAALILSHNHPSGVAEPSAADRQITLRLRDALALVGVRILDHLVIGDGDCCSLAERGLI